MIQNSAIALIAMRGSTRALHPPICGQAAGEFRCLNVHASQQSSYPSPFMRRKTSLLQQMSDGAATFHLWPFFFYLKKKKHILHLPHPSPPLPPQVSKVGQ